MTSICCKLCPRFAALAALGLLPLAGCEQPTAGGGSTRSPGPAASIRLDIVDGQGYEAARARHQGKVVLVDFWATWCEPCVANFPHIVELHHKHAGNGLSVISFSSNEPEEEAEVRKFLAEQGAVFDNLLTRFGNGTQTNDTFGIRGVPFYKLYDRKGVLRYQFAEAHDGLELGQPIENIDQRVAELLAESP